MVGENNAPKSVKSGICRFFGFSILIKEMLQKLNKEVH
jgi:hypothetical protein